MPALAHYSATLQQQPEDPRLQAVEQEINRRPALRRAYRWAPGWIAENGDIAINPSARLLWDPASGGRSMPTSSPRLIRATSP